MTEEIVRDGVVESFWTEFMSYWNRFPNKGLFLWLLAAWVALFHFLGNGTFGYYDTTSIPVWLWNIHVRWPSEDEQGPGMLVPFLIMALFWLKRKELVVLNLRSWPPAMAIVVVGLVLHVLGYMTQQPLISIVALFVGIYGFAGLAWGPQWLWASFFPYALFVFALPLQSMGTMITFPLRLLVTMIVEVVARFVFGVDVVRVGTGLFDASQSFQYDVAPACSGLRSLTAMFFLATVYGYALFRSSWKWVVMLLAAFPLAVLGNAIRLLIIVLAADVLGQGAGDWVHESTLFSMLPYVPVLVGLIWLSRRLSRDTDGPTDGAKADLNKGGAR